MSDSSPFWTIEWPNLWIASDWWPAALLLGGLAFLFTLWSYARAELSWQLRIGCGLLKGAAVGLLAIMLLEPMRREERPVPGSNLFLLLADRSQSLTLKDEGQSKSREEQLADLLDRENPWQVRLGQDFELRHYEFDRQSASVADFNDYQANGDASSLNSALRTTIGRYQDRPVAGVILFTDGNATDLNAETQDWSTFPAIYPVTIGQAEPPKDIRLSRLTASETNFEAAPVTINSEVVAHGYAGESIVVELLDELGESLQQQVIDQVRDDRPFAVRFLTRPVISGPVFYRVRAFAKGKVEEFEQPEESDEATLLNNERMVCVARARGPYRILYVAGRPNWEYKFLNRAVREDPEVELVGLIRIAKREPKFTFRARDDGSNPLFRGFEADAEEVEQFDEPVIVRFNVADQEELRGGFPKSAEELFGYDALILDDIEAEHFTEDQKSLIQEFVSQRGGGFLMLGGQESFADGDYDRTPISDLLPVYLSPSKALKGSQSFRLELTREGTLETWLRTRPTEREEARRLAELPPMKTLNRVGLLKPGATLLAQVRNADGDKYPALATQRFGKGRTAAMLFGDVWRWQLNRPDNESDEAGRTWRQVMRWLIAEVPRRVEVSVQHLDDDPNRPMRIQVKVYDEEYRPLDNAIVSLNLFTPDGSEINLSANPEYKSSGTYTANFASRNPGPYHVEAVAKADDNSDVGTAETGWVADPLAREFEALTPNAKLLESLASQTGGEVLEPNKLDDFVESLQQRKVPVTEEHIFPVWHKWSIFLLAVGLLIGEWGLRRWRGLP